jgi:hypothetical protein
MLVHPKTFFDVALREGAWRHVYAPGAGVKAPDGRVG